MYVVRSVTVAVTMARPMAYFAGFFDAEGTVFIQYRRPRKDVHNGTHFVQVAVVNTNLEVLDLFVRTFGGKYYVAPGTHKPCFRWIIASKKAEVFLRAIYPYLIEKKKRSEYALKLQRHLNRSKFSRHRKVDTKTLAYRESLRTELLKY